MTAEREQRARDVVREYCDDVPYAPWSKKIADVARDSLAGLDRERLLEAELAATKQALRMIDANLTTVEGDNVPVGEACKLGARNIARLALAAAEAPQ